MAGTGYWTISWITETFASATTRDDEECSPKPPDFFCARSLRHGRISMGAGDRPAQKGPAIIECCARQVRGYPEPRGECAARPGRNPTPRQPKETVNGNCKIQRS